MHRYVVIANQKSGIFYIIKRNNKDADAGAVLDGHEGERRTYSGHRAFWYALRDAINDSRCQILAITLNPNSVVDDFLPERVDRACKNSTGVKWAVLSSTGKLINGMIVSADYCSESPHFIPIRIPYPIVDCALELFIVNKEFLECIDIDIVTEDDVSPNYFPMWCIIRGYIEGFVSLFMPDLSIGVNGRAIARDPEKCARLIDESFGRLLRDDSIPSLMGEISLGGSLKESSNRSISDVRSLPDRRLFDYINSAVEAATSPMSLSIVTRTTFKRMHLLYRMLSSVVRARNDLDIDLEVILSTDVAEKEVKSAIDKIKKDFPQLEVRPQFNSDSTFPYSRVRNLIGGIMAAEKEYVVIVDDDDYLHVNSLSAISNARFMGNSPLLIMSSRVHNERWRKSGNKIWILESSELRHIYDAYNVRYMFSGINQLPVCSFVSPRSWIQERLKGVNFRHDLSEDYAMFLILLTSPDLPEILIFNDVFCEISAIKGGDNTVLMEDRRAWVRDITLYLHDIFIRDDIKGLSIAQLMHRMNVDTHQINRQGDAQCEILNKNRKIQALIRNIKILEEEVSYLREILNREGVR